MGTSTSKLIDSTESKAQELPGGMGGFGIDWHIKRQQMAKMDDQIFKDRLGTSRLVHIFLKISPLTPPEYFRKKKVALI